MARATAAEVIKRMGNAYPTGWDATSVGYLCDSADYHIDGYVKQFGGKALSTTDTDAIELAISVVLRLMQIADIMKRSRGIVSEEGRTYMVNLDPIPDWVKPRLETLMTDTTYDGATTASMVED